MDKIRDISACVDTKKRDDREKDEDNPKPHGGTGRNGRTDQLILKVAT